MEGFKMNTPWTAWENKAKACDVDQLRFIIKDCRTAQQAMQGWNPEREGFYSDQASTFTTELNKRTKRKAA
jgi:hypothetical protein